MKTSMTKILVVAILTFLNVNVAFATDSLGTTISNQVKDKLKGVLKNCTPDDPNAASPLVFTCRPTALQVCTLVDNGASTQAELEASDCVTNGVIDHLEFHMTVTDSSATAGHLEMELFDHQPIAVTFDSTKVSVTLNFSELKAADAAVTAHVSPGQPGGLDWLSNTGEIKLTAEGGSVPTVTFEVTQGFDITTTLNDNNETGRLKLGTGSTVLLGAGAGNRSDVGFKLLNAIIDLPSFSGKGTPAKFTGDLFSLRFGIDEINEKFILDEIAAANVNVYNNSNLAYSLTSNGITDGKITFGTAGDGSRVDFVKTTYLGMTIAPEPSPSTSPLSIKGIINAPAMAAGTNLLKGDMGSYVELAPGTLADVVNTNIANRAYSFNSGTGKWEYITSFDMSNNPVMADADTDVTKALYNLSNFGFQLGNIDVAANGMSGSIAQNKSIGIKLTGSLGNLQVHSGATNLLTFTENAGGSSNEINFCPVIDGTDITGGFYFKNHTNLLASGSNVITRPNVDPITVDASAGTEWIILKTAGGLRVNSGAVSITTTSATPFLTSDPCNPGAGTCSISNGPDPGP